MRSAAAILMRPPSHLDYALHTYRCPAGSPDWKVQGREI